MHHCMRMHYVHCVGWVVCVSVCVCVWGGGPVSNQSWCSVKLLDFGDSRCEALETNSVHSSYSQRSSKENLCTARNQAGLEGIGI